MKCPRTGKALKSVKVGGVEVDLSEGCGGVWFDNFELSKFSAPSNRMGEVLVEHLNNFHNPLLETDKRLKCPRDTDLVLMRRFYSGKLQIEIDECPQCGGIWLDAEELEKIHELFPNDGDYGKARKDFAKKVMSSSETKKINEEQDEFVNKLERIANVFKSMAGFKR